MKITKKTGTLIVISAITLIFILPVIGFSILNWGVLPPEKLTPLVIEQTNKIIEAHLDCERVELTYFETYPYLGVKLTNGHLISHTANDSTSSHWQLAIPSDSLLAFKQATISLQPLDYLFGGKITVKDFSLETPRFYGYINKEGHANWDIYKSPSDSTDTKKNNQPIPLIDLQRVRINNGHFTYEDQKSQLFSDIKGFFVRLDGSMREGSNLLDIETGCHSFFFRNPTYSLKNELTWRLKSQLVLADQYRIISLKGAELLIDHLPFTADGMIHFLPEKKLTQLNIEMGLNISDLNDLLKFIPDAYFRNRDKTLAKGSITLEGSLHGFLGDSVIPNVNLCCQIKNGSYHMKEMEQGIDTLEMDLDLQLNGSQPDSSFVSLEQLNMKGLNTSLDMQAKVTNLFKNPTLQANMKGKVDFTRLGEEFLNPDTLLIEGVMDANLTTTFAFNDLLESRFGKIHSAGTLTIDKLKAYSQPLDLDVFIAGTHLSIDTTHQKNHYLNIQNLMRMTMAIDSLNLQYKDKISTNISQLEMLAQTSPVLDTTTVIPMTGRISFNHLRTRTADSVWIVAGQMELKGGIKPSATDKQVPTTAAVFSIDTLKYISIPQQTGIVLAQSSFTLEAYPYREKENVSKSSRSTCTDSIQSQESFLNRWDAQGNVSFNHMRVVSRWFPIPIWMDQTTLRFDSNTMTLADAHLHLGKSNLILNGEINQIRKAMLRGGQLKGNFNLTSDYIDCNQLMQAVNSGMQNEEEASLISLDDATLSQLDSNLLQDSLAQTKSDSSNQLFILPAFLDMALHTHAKRIDFKDLALENVIGEIVLRNQSINLSKLNIQSNMGKGNLTLVYQTPNKQKATTGMDLEMEDVQVEKLIALFPSIDTLVPMLRSFEGLLDCQITATCQLDSTMSLIMPSINSSCYLHGKNMVLLDGETFTEISKTLMFKNKKRNVIDSISVDLAIQNNRIEVFPFLIEMDRYKVAVGGTHNLDMTFNYHLSVLKSPVPFKLGIDITGNLDDFKYKITKCRYKDIFKPAKQAELDSTRMNLRTNIRKAIRKQMEQSAPELENGLVALQKEQLFTKQIGEP